MISGVQSVKFCPEGSWGILDKGTAMIEDTDYSQLPMQAEELLSKLDSLGISHDTVTHAPVHTVNEAKAIREMVNGAHTKNLFLHNKKGAMWLVTLLEDKRADLKALSGVLGAGKLSFASPERLLKHLGVFPGSVTPFSVINDIEHAVTFVLDKELMEYDALNFHPLRNDRTTNIASRDLLVFARAVSHIPAIIEIPQRIEA